MIAKQQKAPMVEPFAFHLHPPQKCLLKTACFIDVEQLVQEEAAPFILVMEETSSFQKFVLLIAALLALMHFMQFGVLKALNIKTMF